MPDLEPILRYGATGVLFLTSWVLWGALTKSQQGRLDDAERFRKEIKESQAAVFSMAKDIVAMVKRVEHDESFRG